jgi:hypothetical protein
VWSIPDPPPKILPLTKGGGGGPEKRFPHRAHHYHGTFSSFQTPPPLQTTYLSNPLTTLLLLLPPISICPPLHLSLPPITSPVLPPHLLMAHLSSTHLRVTSPYHSRLSSPARCSTAHLHLGRWSPSHLLSWPFLCPHIITLCHFTSDLSQCSTHIFQPTLSRSPSICHVCPYGRLSSHLHIDHAIISTRSSSTNLSWNTDL